MTEIFRFGNEKMLYLLLILPVLLIVFVYARVKYKSALKKFGENSVIQALMPFAAPNKSTWKFILILLALVALIFALADPQYGSKLEKMKRRGVEIVIALDVSNSMLAEDIKPNRLERAKQAISQLVGNLENDRVGLIVFAGDAYVQVPVTQDYSAAKMFLSSINTDIVPVQGTAIGTAINLAMKSFNMESELEKAIIIITDGENHEDNAVSAAEAALKEGIQVHTIGMGSKEGAPIPIAKAAGQSVFQKDKDGNVVVSKLNQNMLQQIAASGGGTFVMSNNTTTGLNDLYREINQMDEKEIETRVYTDFEHRFQYLLGLAIFFLLLEMMILNRKNKRLQGINLFKMKV